MSITILNLDKVISQIEDYRKGLQDKVNRFLERLSTLGAYRARVEFTNAMYAGTNDVMVSVETTATGYQVVAAGQAVLFIEFGTGVKYPDNHPEAGKHGMVRGQNGYKLGRLPQGWRYEGAPGSNGEVITEGKHVGEVHTYGNPANMSMYQTIRELEEKFEEIARRVYV